MQYQNYDYANAENQAPWLGETPSASILASRENSLGMSLTPNPVMPANTQAPSNVPETIVLSALIQAVQQTQTQQMFLLRNLDARLARLEESPRPFAAVRAQGNAQTQNGNAFERATWWAIWGLLMLILGGALSVVLLLIMLNLQFR